MASVGQLLRNNTTKLDPVGCCLALEGRLNTAEGREGLTGALRQASQSGDLGCRSPPEQPTLGTDASTAGPRCLSSKKHQLPAEFLSAFAASSSSSTTDQAVAVAEPAALDIPNGQSISSRQFGSLPQQDVLKLPLASGRSNSSSNGVGAQSAAAGALSSSLQRPPSSCISAAIERTSTATLDANGGVDHGAGVNDPSCTCPPYAVKSTCGKRPNMEDTYALCPNICELPMSPMSHEYADKLPHRIAVQFENCCTYVPVSLDKNVQSNPATCSTSTTVTHQQAEQQQQQRQQQKTGGSPAGLPHGQQQLQVQLRQSSPTAQHQAAAAPLLQQVDSAAVFAGAANLPPAALVDCPDAENSVSSVSSGSDGGCVEKLHFFGVYDGHGGIEASQHCAQRLHYHLSKAVADMASLWLETSAGEEVAGAWDPEVKYVPLETARVDNTTEVGSGDCSLVAAAAAAVEAAAAGNSAGAGASSLSGGSCSSQGTFASSSNSSGASSAPADLVLGHSLGRSISNTSTGASGGVCQDSEGDSNEASSSSSGDASEGTAMSFSGMMEDVLREAFLKTDEEFSNSGLQAGLVGSTAVVALVGTHRVWIANCGDSRAVLSRGGKAIQVTDDHKPEREDEAERVEKAGGQVLYWNGHRVMGVLAMSRAIGDHCLRPYVIPEPEISVFARHAGDEILLLASDGLWDVLSNQEATDLALRSIKRARDKGASRKAAARVAATVLTKAAVDKGSRDNITVVIIDLSPLSPGGDKPAADSKACNSSCNGAASSPETAAKQQQQQHPQRPQPIGRATASASRDRALQENCTSAVPVQPGAAACTDGSIGNSGSSRSSSGSARSSSRPSSVRVGGGCASNPFAAAAASPFSTAATGSSELPLPSGASANDQLPTTAGTAMAAAALAVERSSRASTGSGTASNVRLRSSAAGSNSTSSSGSAFAAAGSSGLASCLPTHCNVSSAGGATNQATALADELDSIDLSGAGCSRLRGALPSIASMAAASSAATSTTSSHLEEQPTIVEPPPMLQRQASSSPFSAFQGAPPFDND